MLMLAGRSHETLPATECQQTQAYRALLCRSSELHNSLILQSTYIVILANTLMADLWHCLTSQLKNISYIYRANIPQNTHQSFLLFYKNLFYNMHPINFLINASVLLKTSDVSCFSQVMLFINLAGLLAH